MIISLWMSRSSSIHIAEMSDGTVRHVYPTVLGPLLNRGWFDRGRKTLAHDGYPSIEPAMCGELLVRSYNRTIFGK